jgi:hypothetical protein
MPTSNPELRIVVLNPLRHMGPSGIPGELVAYAGCLCWQGKQPVFSRPSTPATTLWRTCEYAWLSHVNCLSDHAAEQLLCTRVCELLL